MAVHTCSCRLLFRTNTCVSLFKNYLSKRRNCAKQQQLLSTLTEPIKVTRSFIPISKPTTRFFFIANHKCYSTRNPVQPHMIYFQNPIVWLSNRWDFFLLKMNWDPAFRLTDFRRGCRQALCTITQCIAQETYGDLKGLISAQTLDKLRDEVNSAWNETKRKDIGLLPNQVHVVLPHKVYLHTVVENKYCDIDMILVAFKPRSPTRIEPHVGLLIEAAIRFHRNYTDGVLPEWTVTRLFLKSRDVHLEKRTTNS